MKRSSFSAGTGLRFPIGVNPVTGRMEECSYEESIRESICLIIMTKKGERVMRPDFGCDIHQYLFENVNYTMLCLIQRMVEAALIQWEPRITEITAEVTEAENHRLLLTIRYRIRTTGILSQTEISFDMLGS